MPKKQQTSGVSSNKAGGPAETTLDDVRFGIAYNIEYCEDLENFWGFLNSLTLALSVIFGLVVVADAMKDYSGALKILASVVAALNVLSLTFKFSETAIKYLNFRLSFGALKTKLDTIAPGSESDVISEYNKLASSTPPEKSICKELAFNKAIDLLGYDKCNLYKIPIYKFITRHFISWPSSKQIKDSK
jgi:hypothetical protein